MSRYYSIAVTPQGGGTSRVWTSMPTSGAAPGGSYDPGALNVEFDFFTAVQSISTGASTVTIEGVALADISAASQFAGSSIIVKGGMMAGLPLANPAQAGTILQGMILQSFGNWVGTEMTLDFVVVGSAYTIARPGQFVLNWQKGQSLQSALSACLNIAYPSTTVNFAIGTHTATQNIVHVYPTLGGLAKMIASYTGQFSPPAVQITTLPNGQIGVSDGSVTSAPIQLVFTDLIGQPTWIDPLTIQFSTVMRADIQVGNQVLMPQGVPGAPGIVGTTANAAPSTLGTAGKYASAFQGTFVIQSVRQIGNYRDAAGASWCSVFQAAAVGGASTTSAGTAGGG